VVAAGGMNSCVGSNCGAGVIGEAGLGFTYEINDNFLLRSDVRYRYNNNLNNHMQPGTDEFHDRTVNVGFVIPFGDKPKSATKTETLVATNADCSKLDKDADGVNDCLDRFSGTPKGSKVDPNGCLTGII
jgi:OOP family OmpA-OmpF porin